MSDNAEGSTHSLAPSGPTVLLPRFRVRIVEGIDQGAQATSRSERLVVGTHEGADLRLTDPTVSRFHLELMIDPGGLCIRDLGSRNGTRVNGVKIQTCWVEAGARIELGETVALLEAEGRSVAAPVSSKEQFGKLVGSSEPMRQTFAALERVAPLTTTVLLLGETGTGKEAAAESIHEHSPRKDRPFIVVDCAALPGNLLESELFGHEKGAFTGASAAHEGALAAAHGGTIFFDEIGELPPDLQPKLLRVLERREVKRVGGVRYQPVDVRIIAATHRDLRGEVNARTFRSDLYYRLAVVEVRLPPLRERLADLPLLVDRLAEHLGASPQQRQELLSNPAFLADLRGHRWPGNVRELRNYLERGLALGAWSHRPMEPVAAAEVEGALLPFKEARLRWNLVQEKIYLERLLARHEGSVSAAARAAQIDRMYLYRLLWRHQLK